MTKPDTKKPPKPPAASDVTTPDKPLPSRIITSAFLLIKSALLLFLLGAFATASQLNLSPVYGSVPAARWHTYVLATGCFAGWASSSLTLTRRPLPPRTTQLLLPLIALCVPSIHFSIFKISGLLGPRIGPLATEFATLFPLAALTASSVATSTKTIPLRFPSPALVADALPALLSWALTTRARALSAQHFALHVGQAFHYTRVGMQICLAALSAVLAPSAYLLLALPALLHTALVNPHVATFTGTKALNGTLQDDGWMLLDRRESVTGYISVTQNMNDMARVLRADHSLLGGDWVDFRGPLVTEPVYSVFVMLEAVRLVERREPLPDADATALVIGLGIGTVPSALVAHGIDTTVVEIDPAVYDFAKKYFRLRETRPAVIEDAVAYADRLAQQGGTTFDYIVHDVFTGGAEPVDLFTLEFFQNLNALLHDDGVIAINYAGDLMLPTPKIILNTIQAVFPICRMFRESPADPALLARTGSDYTNLIFFCRKTPPAHTGADHGEDGDPDTPPLAFREPVDQDRLKSRARYAYLVPKIEVLPDEFHGESSSPRGRAGKNVDAHGSSILTKAETGSVEEWHRRSATGHWMIMRSVLRSSFWEKW